MEFSPFILQRILYIVEQQLEAAVSLDLDLLEELCEERRQLLDEHEDLPLQGGAVLEKGPEALESWRLIERIQEMDFLLKDTLQENLLRQRLDLQTLKS